MAEDAKISRKLTTILSADIAGYSSLMESDEAGTMEKLRQHRGLLMAFIERHHGRVVNTAGDGLLAEFASVVEAVLCAIEVQRELAARTEPSGVLMQYRIGINLGDVMIDSDDLFGEGVNVAARLQGLAEPGGIMISGTVHDLVRGKLDVTYDYLGPQQVKNITGPVPAYRISLDGSTGAAASDHRTEHTQSSSGDQQPASSGPRRLAEAIGSSPSPLIIMAAVLLAFSILPSLGWIAWPSLVLAYVTGIAAIARRLRGRANVSAQIGLVAVFLLGINILSGSDNWWFIYPGVVLTALAIAIYPNGLSQLTHWLKRT